MSKKTLLITGCSSGIGYECAKELKMDENIDIIVTVRRDESIEKLISEGFNVVKMDMSNEKSIKKGFNEVVKRKGDTLYALFNNAGYGQPGAVEDLPICALKEQFDTNFFGLVYLTNLFVKYLRKENKSGKIIQNSSILGFVSFKYRGAYNASKFAVEAISDALRLELRDSGITVSLIEPGPIRSSFRKNAYRKFIEHIDYDHSFHKDAYIKNIERFESDKDDPFTLSSSAVCKVLKRILNSKKPKARYQVTFPTKLFWYLKRALSTFLLDEIVDRI